MELAQNIGSTSFSIQDLFSMLKFVTSKSKVEKRNLSSSTQSKAFVEEGLKPKSVTAKRLKTKSAAKVEAKDSSLPFGIDFDFSIISVTELIKVLTKLMVELDSQIVKMSKDDATKLLGEVGKHPELVELMHSSVDNFEPETVDEFNLNLAMRGLVNQFTLVFEKLTLVSNRESFDEESADYRDFLYDLIYESPRHNNRAVVAKNVDDLFSKL